MRTYGTLTYDKSKNQWVLDKIAPHVSIRLKQVFPSIPIYGTCPYQLRNTPDMCTDLLWFTERYPLDIDGASKMLLQEGKREHLLQIARSEEILLPGYKPQPASLKEGETARQYQLVGRDFHAHMQRILLGDDVGLGKTLTGILTQLDPANRPCAVVVQSHLPTHWIRQIKRFTNLTAHKIKKSSAYSLPPADVYIFKYGSLSGWVNLFDQGYFKSAIFDEIQEVRRKESQKHKSCKVLSLNVNAVLAMSATPLYNYGGEMWNIMEVVKPGCLGVEDDFLREWCRPIGSKKYALNDPDAFGMYLRDNNLMLRRTRKDVGRELPPVNKIVMEVDYDEKVAHDAEKLAEKLAIRVVSGGFHESGEAARELNNILRHATGVAKAKSVAAHVKILLDQDIPIVLAGWHRDVYDIWLQELKDYNPVMYTGSESPSQKDKAAEAFISGKTNLFIISLRSGIGLDGLQNRSKFIVVGELDWSPKVLQQLIGRLDRDREDEQEQVTAMYMVSEFGSDPTMIDILAAKADQARGIEDPLAGVEEIFTDTTQIKALAMDFLNKRGVKIPDKQQQLFTE